MMRLIDTSSSLMLLRSSLNGPADDKKWQFDGIGVIFQIGKNFFYIITTLMLFFLNLQHPLGKHHNDFFHETTKNKVTFSTVDDHRNNLQRLNPVQGLSNVA